MLESLRAPALDLRHSVVLVRVRGKARARSAVELLVVCMLHLIWTCILDQHFIRRSLSGDLSCNAITLSMADVVYPSLYDYHLPESLASACELGHGLHYLREFDSNDEFLTSEVLRHNFDLSTDDYTNGPTVSTVILTIVCSLIRLKFTP